MDKEIKKTFDNLMRDVATEEARLLAKDKIHDAKDDRREMQLDSLRGKRPKSLTGLSYEGDFNLLDIL